MKRISVAGILTILVICSSSAAYSRTYIVGTKEAPPFAIKNRDGSWRGISIDLWRDIARDMGIRYKIREYSLKNLLTAVEKGTVDVAVAALTISPQREERFDFTHHFYQTGLGIAVSADKRDASPLVILKQIFTFRLVSYIFGLLLLLSLVGFVIWILERRKKNSPFRKGKEGVGDGFWWSAVTMTTVGYGDFAPTTFWGRVLGVFWMFTAIIVLSFFTAGIASSLTVNQLSGLVNGPKDLPGVRVGTVNYSFSEAYLKRKDIDYTGYKNITSGMKDLSKGKIDAFVYDHAILQYYAYMKFKKKVDVLDVVFNPQSYGIAVPPLSPLRERINRVLLKKKMNERYWNQLTRRYLGD